MYFICTDSCKDLDIYYTSTPDTDTGVEKINKAEYMGTSDIWTMGKP